MSSFLPRILCIDVDGTLVDAAGELYIGAERLIASVRQAGFEVGLCSARPARSLRSVATAVGGVDFIVALQGAYAIHRAGSEWVALWSIEIDPESLDGIRALGSEEQVELWSYDEDSWATALYTESVRREAEIIRQEPVVRNEPQQRTLKISLVEPIAHRSGRFAETRPIMIADERLRAVPSHPHMLEVTSARAGDSKGVTGIRAMFGDRAVVVAVGDSLKDVGMVSASDVAFTFDNAPLATMAGHCQLVRAPERGGLMEIAAALLAL